MTSGVRLQGGPALRPFRPSGPVRRPMGWMGYRGFVPTRGKARDARWALLGVLLALVLAGGGAAAATVAAPAEPTGPALACAPAGAAGGLTAEQRRNATTIIAVGQAMDVPPRAQVISLATAMQESSLINLGGRGKVEDGGDRDSAGLFQQRPSQGWGSFSQVTDPRYSTETFLKRLLAMKNWDEMTVTVAAQKVQRSAYPDAYAKWETPAKALVAGTTCKKT